MSSDKTESDVAFISALAAILRDSDLSEIDVKREYGEGDELKVRLSKGGAVPVAAAVSLPAPAAPPPAPPQEAARQASPQSAPPVAESTPAADPAASEGMVPSPMVGTAYLAPEPGASPFVEVGGTVKQGQTILIIEAMKTMNQIPAPRDGTVRVILVDDGAPVEFGMPLMVIE